MTVENCRMPEIWPSIYKLTGLKDLDLSGNKIAKISNKKIKKMVRGTFVVNRKNLPWPQETTGERRFELQ